MKQSLSLNDNWYLSRKYGTSRAYRTDYWVVLQHNECNKFSTIGHKSINENLVLWMKSTSAWCNKCYKSLPDFPIPKQIQDYFTLYDIADLKIRL